jgi:hypothetical protein
MTINNVTKGLVASLFAAGVLAGATVNAQAQSGNLACSCTGLACGNGAVGGNQGDIFTGLSQSTVNTYFTPNPNTGWTCVPPAAIRSGPGGPLGCFCQYYCGNGGIGANPNTFDLHLNQTRVNTYYGGGHAGNQTGWLCGNYRGSFSARHKR